MCPPRGRGPPPYPADTLPPGPPPPHPLSFPATGVLGPQARLRSYPLNLIRVMPAKGVVSPFPSARPLSTPGKGKGIMGFAKDQLQVLHRLWEHMLSHPFLLGTRDGTLPRETFLRWMQQDYLFVEAAIPFFGVLLSKAPPHHRRPLSQAVEALHKELALFEERAEAVGASLEGVVPTFTCHAYIQFLMATAYQRSYPEAYTVLYAAEKAYHDSWKVVRQGLDPSSPWMPFVENWAGEAFGGYVAYLETELDLLAEAAGPKERARMSELFRLTTLYEIAFWDMALSGAGWPGATDDIWQVRSSEG